MSGLTTLQLQWIGKARCRYECRNERRDKFPTLEVCPGKCGSPWLH